MTVFQKLGDVWNAVCSAVSGFWNTYIKPIVDFIWNAIKGAFEFWINIIKSLGDVWNAICSGISAVWNTLVKLVVDAVKWFCDAVYNAFKWLFGWIIGGSFWTDMCKGIVNVWKTVVEPLVGAIKGFCDAVAGAFKWLSDTLGGIWNGICNAAKGAWDTICNAGKGIVDAVGGAAKAAGDALGNFANAAGKALSDAGKAVWDFITGICFAHAIHNAVESSVKDLGEWVDVVEDSMNKGIKSVKDFIAEVDRPALTVGGVAGGAASVGLAPSPVPAPAAVSVTVNITAPLVNVEGSADKRTVELAVEKVKEALKTTLIEATSAGAPTKRIRVLGGVAL